MYPVPLEFFGLEHLASSCRSAFDHSFSFSRRFIHSSGWWNGSGIRRRAVEASRTHLKSSRSVSIAPLATLRSACHCLLPPLHSFVRGLKRSFNKSKSVRSHRSSYNTSASVVNLRCGGRSGVQPSINTEFQARNTQGFCKLLTERQRDTWIPEHRVHRRLKCLPYASHVSSTICISVLAEFTIDTVFKRKTRVIHKRDISQRGGDPVSSVMLGVLFDTCLCFRRHVPGWLCRVVRDLFRDFLLFAAVRIFRNTCSYIRQYLPAGTLVDCLVSSIQPYHRWLASRLSTRSK